ncbi:OmpA family protein [Kordiimonas sp. SCSIO 12610]|uniref:OmpA family protein n=1 Tax=Kordiimonas sp. SCSIO 12610 TaxID=2829597 RepID=UPI00210B26D9|nr:OmpA family protein [Kordiimonas sp. SCSIO 12610]UTW56451.1 OmpA family protein [Kordiimonas sp. SCSIO 12610]
MSESFGKKVAIISAVTLLLAACSKDNNVDESTSGVDNTPPVVEETTNTGPETVAPKPYDPLTGTELRDLEAYAGGDRVYFEYDSSELNANARETLAKQAQWLQGKRINLTIEGHCDERGTREYNLALGERRATAVKNYLVTLGVPASRLSTISYGKERPVSAGNHGQNRRGVLTFN